jgi:hypothetical protein
VFGRDADVPIVALLFIPIPLQIPVIFSGLVEAVAPSSSEGRLPRQGSSSPGDLLTRSG